MRTPTAPTPETIATSRPATRLLAGDATAFADSAWGRRMHLHPGDPVELAGLLTLDDVDHLLTGTTIRTPEVRLARDGHVLSAGAFTRRASLAGQSLGGLVDPRRLLDEFDDGATIVLQGLQRSWPPLVRLLGDLERELGHPCQANAYLTPPSSQGFDLHHDSHDVFVVQTHGRKAWEVHDDRGQHDLLLEPGTSLYLPTGTDHLAHTQESASLHVTIGIRQLTWRHVLDRTVRAALDDLDAAASDDVDGGLDRLPAGWLDDPDATAACLRPLLAGLATHLADRDPGAEVAREVDRFWTTRTSTVPGGLRDRLDADAIGDDTLVARRPGHAALLRPAVPRRHDEHADDRVGDAAADDEGDRDRGDDSEDDVRLLLGDREIAIPAWVRPALEELVGRDELRPADLEPWLDATSRVVLVRRLVVEGLLGVVR